jgi:predicted transcriptional regulator
MNKSLTIQIPEDLEQQLTLRAAQLDVSLETLILESLLQVVQDPDPDDTPKEEILASLHRAFEDIQAGRVIPLSELWDFRTATTVRSA